MTPDASSYPFPTVARLALSLYASDRRVERLPTVREWLPHERVDLAPQWDSIEVNNLTLAETMRHVVTVASKVTP